jgi:hypothetical protein
VNFDLQWELKWWILGVFISKMAGGCKVRFTGASIKVEEGTTVAEGGKGRFTGQEGAVSPPYPPSRKGRFA